MTLARCYPLKAVFDRSRLGLRWFLSATFAFAWIVMLAVYASKELLPKWITLTWWEAYSIKEWKPRIHKTSHLSIRTLLPASQF
jgi:hypothetical protein